jgi:LacI family repressor for deo operon, udp, cdd, tsx, nupC, and nupG
VPNIFEVAKRAGVSIATVSRVLSRPEAVAANTRRKVMQAVSQLGYAPNSAGKHLRTQKSGKLLVLVPDISNPFYSRILQSIEETAQRAGYAVLLGDTQQDVKREERYTQMLRRREAEGLIVVGHALPEAAISMSQDATPGAPIVAGCEVNRLIQIPSVHIDNQAAARDAMEHLYGLGHRRIGVVTGPMSSGLSRERLQGATACAKAHGADRDLIVVNGEFTIESGRTAGEQLLKRHDPPTALFCFNDLMAIGAMNVARAFGTRVPEELSVVGFDDIAFAAYTVPPLTTVAQPVREIGQETVRLVLGIINRQTMTPVSVILRHSLVVRESTAAAPR